MTSDIEILQALHDQVQRMGLPGSDPVSPTEHKLANAILVLLNVLIAERQVPKSSSGDSGGVA